MGQSIFKLDEQTLNEIAVFPNIANDIALLNLFNHTSTFGGSDKLIEILNCPLTEIEQVEQRIDAIKYLQQADIGFKADKKACNNIEFYLNQPDKPSSVSRFKAIERRILNIIKSNNDFYFINKGVKDSLNLLRILDDFTQNTNFNDLPQLLRDFFLTIRNVIGHADFIFVNSLFEKKKLNAIDIAKADHLFRNVGYDRLKILLDKVYQLDVFIAVGKVSKKRGFTLPVINRSDARVLKFKGLFHPFINNPVNNDIEFNYNKNTCFVAGPNIDGKSVFLKSVRISIFLSRIGFPVPAAYMETSMLNGALPQ